MTVTWTPEQRAAVEDADRRAEQQADQLDGADLEDFFDWWREHYPDDALAMVREWSGQ